MAEDEHPAAKGKEVIVAQRSEAAVVCPKHGQPLLIAPGLWTITTILRGELGLARTLFCRSCHVEESAGVQRPMPRSRVEGLMKR